MRLLGPLFIAALMIGAYVFFERSGQDVPALSLATESQDRNSATSDGHVVVPDAQGDVTITDVKISEHLNPEDPSTWPASAKTEVVDVGEYMDAEDPSTWPVSDITEVVDVGDHMDAEDPSTWPVSDITEVVDVGEYMDAEDPSTWPVSNNTDIVDIRETEDPIYPSEY